MGRLNAGREQALWQCLQRGATRKGIGKFQLCCTEWFEQIGRDIHQLRTAVEHLLHRGYGGHLREN